MTDVKFDCINPKQFLVNLVYAPETFIFKTANPLVYIVARKSALSSLPISVTNGSFVIGSDQDLWGGVVAIIKLL